MLSVKNGDRKVIKLLIENDYMLTLITTCFLALLVNSNTFLLLFNCDINYYILNMFNVRNYMNTTLNQMILYAGGGHHLLFKYKYIICIIVK